MSAAQADEAAARSRARDALIPARRLIYLGCSPFPTVTGAVGILLGVLPILAVVAGFVGLNRLNSAQRELEATRKRVEAELDEARQRFAQEMESREAELNTLRDSSSTSPRSSGPTLRGPRWRSP
jgi:hypothetical protein